MDERSADRIFAAMGKPAVRFDQLDKAALFAVLSYARNGTEKQPN